MNIYLAFYMSFFVVACVGAKKNSNMNYENCKLGLASNINVFDTLHLKLSCYNKSSAGISLNDFKTPNIQLEIFDENNNVVFLPKRRIDTRGLSKINLAAGESKSFEFDIPISQYCMCKPSKGYKINIFYYYGSLPDGTMLSVKDSIMYSS